MEIRHSFDDLQAARQSGAGVLHLWHDMALVMAPALPSDCHRHFAAQLMIAMDGCFMLRSSAREPWGQHGVAWIPSRAWHQTAAVRANVLMLYVHPASPIARAMDSRNAHPGAIRPLQGTQVEVLRHLVRAAQGEPCALRSALEAHFQAQQDTQAVTDSRVERVLRALATDPSQQNSLAALARQAGLSQTRLRHLFREQVGLPLAAYRLWSRLLIAVRQLAIRPDLTAAAHDSGFSDSAHLSHAFRQIFGLRPSGIFKSAGFSVRLHD